MRRRTKSFLLGLTTGAIVMSLLLLVAYYFFAYRPFNDTVANYKLLLENYQKPATVDVVKLTKDLRQYDVVTANDFELVKIPLKYASDALFSAEEDLIGLTATSDLAAGTLLHDNMVYSAEELPKDLRVYQIGNLLTQPYLEVGSSVDVRISFPSGLDYIVLSKKVLIDKRSRSEEETAEVCVFHLNEDEILRLSSALVDAYLHEGTYLYTTLYVSGSSQMAAEVTYPANAAVKALIDQDPNIVERAIVALEEQKRQQLARSLAGLPEDGARPVIESELETPLAEPTSQSDDEQNNEVEEVN